VYAGEANPRGSFLGRLGRVRDERPWGAAVDHGASGRVGRVGSSSILGCWNCCGVVSRKDGGEAGCCGSSTRRDKRIDGIFERDPRRGGSKVWWGVQQQVVLFAGPEQKNLAEKLRDAF
jgi:hypothetical protein